MAARHKTGGRKAGTPNNASADLRAVAQQHTEAAIARLAYLMEHAESEQAQVAAARELLDRAHGRPAQAIVAISPTEPDVVAEIMATVAVRRGTMTPCVPPTKDRLQ